MNTTEGACNILLWCDYFLSIAKYMLTGVENYSPQATLINKEFNNLYTLIVEIDTGCKSNGKTLQSCIHFVRVQGLLLLTEQARSHA